MATPKEEQRKEVIAQARRELHRRSLDQIAVLNPLKEAFKTIYDGFTHVANPGTESVFPRYVAEKWMREYTDFRINEDERIAVDKENATRSSKGWNPLSPEEKNDFVSAHNLLTNNQELRMQYMREVYKGISKEHGMDVPPPAPKERDRRPMDEKLLSQLDEEMGTEFPEVELDVEDKKDEFIKEIESA